MLKALTRASNVAVQGRSLGSGFLGTDPQGFAIIRGDNPTQYQVSGKNVRVQGFERHPVAHTCARVVADVAGSVPIEAYEELEDGDSNTLVDHPGSLLLQRPRVGMNDVRLRRLTFIHYQLYGNAFWLLEREDPSTSKSQVNGIRLIQPEWIQYVYLDPVTLEVLWWRWRDRVGRSHLTVAYDMVHFKDITAGDFLFGYPRAATALLQLSADTEATQYVRQLVTNHGSPGVLVTVPQETTDDQMKMAKKRFQEVWNKRGGRGGVGFVRDVEEVIQVGFNLENLEFPELRHISRQDIATAFNVDPVLVGATAATRRGSTLNAGNKYQEARKRLVLHTCKPIMIDIEAELNNWYAPEWDQPAKYRFSVDALSNLTEDAKETSDRMIAEVQARVRTREEARSILDLDAALPPKDTIIAESTAADRTVEADVELQAVALDKAKNPPPPPAFLNGGQQPPKALPPGKGADQPQTPGKGEQPAETQGKTAPIQALGEQPPPAGGMKDDRPAVANRASAGNLNGQPDVTERVPDLSMPDKPPHHSTKQSRYEDGRWNDQAAINSALHEVDNMSTTEPGWGRHGLSVASEKEALGALRTYLAAQKRGQLDPTLTTMDITKLHATQDDIDKDKLRSLLKAGKRPDPPEVVMLQGKAYIADGHHRVMAEKLMGRSSMDVKLHKLKADHVRTVDSRFLHRSRRAALTPEQRTTLWRAADQRARAQEEPYRQAALHQFNQERTDIQRRLTLHGRASGPDPNVMEALKRIQQDYQPGGAYHQAWLDRYRDLIAQSFAVAGSEVAASAGFDFSHNNPTVQAAIDARADNLADYVGQTTSDQISAIVGEGTEQGWGISQIADVIDQAVFENQAPDRADMIAQTETIGALNEGEYVTADDSGLFSSKEWLNQGDDKVRDSHDEYGGMGPVDMDYEFAPGLQHPGDQSAAADEVINCRCSLLFYSDSDQSQERAAPEPAQRGQQMVINVEIPPVQVQAPAPAPKPTGMRVTARDGRGRPSQYELVYAGVEMTPLKNGKGHA